MKQWEACAEGMRQAGLDNASIKAGIMAANMAFGPSRGLKDLTEEEARQVIAESRDNICMLRQLKDIPGGASLLDELRQNLELAVQEGGKNN